MYYWIAGSCGNDDDALILHRADLGDNDIFIGERIGKEWNVPDLKYVDGLVLDFIAFVAGAIVCSTNAKKQLINIISNEVEFLPLGEYKGEKLFVINVVNLIDCLDKDKSDITYLEGGNKILNIDRYSFLEEKIGDSWLFKIPETKGREIIVTEKFKKLVEKHRLSGAKFYSL